MKKTVIFVSVLALWLLSKVKHNGKSVLTKVKEKVKDKVCDFSLNLEIEKKEEKKEDKKELPKAEEKKEAENAKVVGISTTAKPVSSVISTDSSNQLGVVAGTVSSTPISTINSNNVPLSVEKSIKNEVEKNPHEKFIEDEKGLGSKEPVAPPVVESVVPPAVEPVVPPAVEPVVPPVVEPVVPPVVEPVAPPVVEPVAPPVVEPVAPPVVEPVAPVDIDNSVEPKDAPSEISPNKPVVIVDPIDDGSREEEERVNPANSSVISPEVEKALKDFNNQDPYERFVEHEGENLGSHVGYIDSRPVGLEEKHNQLADYRKMQSLASKLEEHNIYNYGGPKEHHIYRHYVEQFYDNVRIYIERLRNMEEMAYDDLVSYVNGTVEALSKGRLISDSSIRVPFLTYFENLKTILDNAEV